MVSASRSRLGLVPLHAEGAAATDALSSFEVYFHHFLTHSGLQDPVAHQIAYHFGFTEKNNQRHGKRLRPRFTMATAAALGVAPETTYPACSAIEMLHNYSLIHDDIEDSDSLRHGRQTLWAAFGLAHGINAGDAVGALAHLALQPVSERLGADIAMQMSLDLSRANLAMCQGQALDLALEGGAPVDTTTYVAMIGGKTAALFGCAGALGARCAAASEAEIERCRSIGCLFGLGFQIADDISGIWGNTDATGKAPAGDLERRKKTYPIVWALENDARASGAVIATAYAGSDLLSEATIQQLRQGLKACGAYAAARAAADNYFESALQKARGLQPLNDLLLELRSSL